MIAPQPSTAPGPSADLTGTTIGRYYVRALLGSGGQGEVYCAEDLKLNRTVALKRLSPALRSDERYRQRFLREAQRASGLNDAHIAGIYDVLEYDGELLLVMEYVQGSSLRQQLREPLALPEFLKVAIQACEALIAAHENGVVHRDIKPENIMLTSTGRIKVLDFGVAKRLPTEGESVALESTETRAGEISGTPAYMAPELLLRQESDERSDIFSLGVVFYELLAGRHPFLVQGSLVATVDRILHEEPASITTQNSAVPAALEDVVFKMLAKDPAQRHASAQDLAGDLQALAHGGEPLIARRSMRRLRKAAWIGTAIILLVVALIAFSPLRQKLKLGTGADNVPHKKNVAVLPFLTTSGGAESKAFSDGLTETITAKLTQLTNRDFLQVVPPSEIREKGISSAEKARQQFGVNLVLEGSLRQSGGQTRVSYSLVDAETQRQVRADTLIIAGSDPFEVEDRVVASILTILDIELPPKDKETLTARGTLKPEAYDYYLRARGYLQDYHKPENLDNAIAVFNHALDRDPRYAMAYAGLGEAYWHKYENTGDPDWITKASSECDRAVQLEPTLASGHACLGTVHSGTGKYEKAVQDFQKALELEPTSDDAYRGLAFAYERLGKADQAEQTYRRAISLRPHYWAGYSWLGTFYFTRARYAEAAEMFTKVISLEPDNFRGYSNLGAIFVQQGRYTEAIPSLQRSNEIRPTAIAYSNLATAYFYLRRFEDSARTYEQALKLDDRNHVIWRNLGDAYFNVPGKQAESTNAYKKAMSLAQQKTLVDPRNPDLLSHLAVYSAMLQQREEALGYLKQALARGAENADVQFRAALVYNQFGETDSALKSLSKAVAAGVSPSLLRDTPNFDNLRDHPQFKALLSTAERRANGASSEAKPKQRRQ